MCSHGNSLEEPPSENTSSSLLSSLPGINMGWFRWLAVLGLPPLRLGDWSPCTRLLRFFGWADLGLAVLTRSGWPIIAACVCRLLGSAARGLGGFCAVNATLISLGGAGTCGTELLIGALHPTLLLFRMFKFFFFVFVGRFHVLINVDETLEHKVVVTYQICHGPSTFSKRRKINSANNH